MSYTSVGFLESVTETITGAAEQAKGAAEQAALRAGATDIGGECTSDSECGAGTGCCSVYIARVAGGQELNVFRKCLKSSECEAMNAELDCQRRGGVSSDGVCVDPRTGYIIPGGTSYEPSDLPPKEDEVWQAVAPAKPPPSGAAQPPAQSAVAANGGDKTIMYIAVAAVVVGGVAYLAGSQS